MNKKHIIPLFLLILLGVLSGSAFAQESGGQKEKASRRERSKSPTIHVQGTVQDLKGHPIPNALVSGKEGAVEVLTDAEGKFGITVPERSDLFFEANGFESRRISLTAEFPATVSLTPTPFLMGNKDKVNIAFGQVKQRELIGAVSILDPKELKKYDDTENIFDALTGKIPGLLSGYVLGLTNNNTPATSGNAPGLLGNLNIRGYGTPLIIVDGMPRDPSYLNLSEIDQITVLKDGNAAMLWGSQAKNGVILITTRRGQPFKRKMEVSVEKGFQTPVALPKFLGSADYYRMRNEALVNDGLTPAYADSTIAKYANGVNPYRYPSVDMYSREYLKAQRPNMRILSEFSGGNANTQYYANVGWTRTGTLYNLGQAKYFSDNRFNMRANVDFTVNDNIKSSVDAVFIFDENKLPNGNFWHYASIYRPDYSWLLPIDAVRKTPALMNQVNTAKKINDKYILGGYGNIYNHNPYGALFLAGDSTAYKRTASINASVEANLKGIIPGLKFKAYMSFDAFNRYSVQVSNTFAVYNPTWQTFAGKDSISNLVMAGTDMSSGTQTMPIGANVTPQTMWFERALGVHALLNYDRNFNTEHHVMATLMAYWDKFRDNAILVDRKDAHAGFRFNYDYQQRFMVDFSGTYTNGFRFAKGHKGGFAPSLGAAIVVIDEGGPTKIDFLKLRASASIQNIDPSLGTQWRPWMESFAYGSYYNFNDANPARQTRSITLMRSPNPGLTFEKMKSINIGLEGYFYDHLLYVVGNFFYTRWTNQVVFKGTTIYPYWVGNMSPYENYRDYKYSGAELGATINKSLGKFNIQMTANMLWDGSKIMKTPELYGYDYLYRKGKSVDNIYGLVSLGFFKDAQDIASSPRQMFSTPRPGDLKYQDQNNDGMIDGNDQVMIGNSQPKFTYGLNLVIKYANFILMATGDGAAGYDYIRSGNYNWIQSDVRYSDVILNRWTTATTNTATYPRLSSGGNSNNYQNSTFWLTKGDYFSLNRVQLTFDVPKKSVQNWPVKEISVYLRGSNLSLWCKNSYNRQVIIEGEPNYRTYALGVNVLF